MIRVLPALLLSLAPSAHAWASEPVREPTPASATAPEGYGIAEGLVGLPRYEAFVLKSGAWLYVAVPTVREPASVSWLRDAPGWDAVVRTCPLADADAWLGLAGFFGSVAAQQVPSTHQLRGTDGHTACVITTAWGATEQTRKVVVLTVAPASGPSFQTSLARREAEALAARLAALAREVKRLPEPEPEAPAAPTPAQIEEVAVVAARTLYAIKGWRRAGDPGWEADVDAVRRAMEVGWLPSDVVVRGVEDRRMRPGALADVLGL